MAQPQFAGGTSIYQGATPIGQPQYPSGSPAVPNQGDMPMGHTKFPQQGTQEHVVYHEWESMMLM